MTGRRANQWKKWVLEKNRALGLENKRRQQNLSSSELWMVFENLCFKSIIQNSYIWYLQDLIFLAHIFYQWEHSMKSSLENLFHPGMYNYLLLQQGTIDLISFYDIAMDNQWWDCIVKFHFYSVNNTDCIIADYKVYFQKCKCTNVDFWFSASSLVILSFFLTFFFRFYWWLKYQSLNCLISSTSS